MVHRLSNNKSSLHFKERCPHGRGGRIYTAGFSEWENGFVTGRAVADLIASDSEFSHQLALKQMRGGFSGEIEKLRQELIHFASLFGT